MFFVQEYNFGWHHFHLWIWLYKVFSIPTEIQLAVALNYEGGLKIENSLQAFAHHPSKMSAMEFPLHEMEHKTCQNWCQ